MQKTENKQNLVENMFEAGAQYGYSKTRRHPTMSEYIYTTKNKSDIINLEKTEVLLNKAIEFVSDISNKGKKILFVGTKPEAKNIIKNCAESIDMPFVIERWIGGTLTNFDEIKKRIIELEEYKKEEKEGTLNKYTKKERLMLSKKMEKLEKYYGGLLGMKKKPDALFIIDPKNEKIALQEAYDSNIPTIALANTDCNIKDIKYLIPGNDGSMKSIQFFTEKISKSYKIN